MPAHTVRPVSPFRMSGVVPTPEVLTLRKELQALGKLVCAPACSWAQTEQNARLTRLPCWTPCSARQDVRPAV